MLSIQRSCTNCRTKTLAVTAVITGGLCVLCSRKWRHSSKDAAIPADQSLWSEASKRSRSYEPNAEVHYYDEFYWCELCETPCVFSASDQKHAYEVEKRYLHQTRKLCDTCYEKSRNRNASGA